MALGRPSRLTIRTYQVGFGDCFLLTFHYKAAARHVLIDFGSTAVPRGRKKNFMVAVAEDIKSRCGGKLHGVVATHRHRDHIGGFATAKSGKGSGDIIASCAPDIVVQPWTEHPRAARGAMRPPAVSKAGQAFVQSLASMQQLAEGVAAAAQSLRGGSFALRREIAFLGEDNIKNPSAVKNLMTMGRKPGAYVHFGSKSGLESSLPGVRIRVLGPPTLEQSSEIREQRSRDAAEFWHLRLRTGFASDIRVRRLFPKARVAGDPPYARWLRRRLRDLNAEELLAIVRILDEQMNNTSLILLFEAGGKRFLFPGDAQIENWRYALSKAGIRKLLKGVDVYKVGHHGSLNATPKTLWGLFEKRGRKGAKKRMTSLLSTMAGKHGRPPNTEVPRGPLVAALRSDTDFFTTQSLKGGRLSEAFEFKLTGK